MRSQIQAVTFDVGGTLIEPCPSVGHVYAEVAARFGIRADADRLTKQFIAAWKSKQNFDYTRKAWFELVQRTFGSEVQLPGEFFPSVYERFAQPDTWRVFDDVLPALDALAAQGRRLGVISNWDERLPSLLRRLELDKWFEVTIVSCDVGFAKPSREIFEHALRKLGLPPESVFHVGDGPDEDFAGARAAGLEAALIRRTETVSAARTLRSLLEIHSIIGPERG